jgi:prepilin-type N-terminal cleavage/methylation domain-containing protein/prepilin-type processing-associated H-X9-DG protein
MIDPRSTRDIVRPLRSGFTLIELLVVIAIIGILVGMLLPAIQMVRASAARSQCAHNLHEIGVALHNYHDSRNAFPPGYSAAGEYFNGATDTTPGWGWAAYLLPYLEQQTLYNQLDLNQPVESSIAIQTFVQTYLCPSDLIPTGAVPISDAFGNAICLAAPSSYAACCGGDESDTSDPTGLGVFYRNSHTRLTDITDGTSQTILVGERAFANAQGIWAGAINGGMCWRGANDPATENSGQNAFPAPCLVLGHSHLNNPDGDTDASVDDFSSMHPGGSNILFADGAVHFIRTIPRNNPDGSYTQDSLNFQGLGTRANGEVVPYMWDDN